MARGLWWTPPQRREAIGNVARVPANKTQLSEEFALSYTRAVYGGGGERGFGEGGGVGGRRKRAKASRVSYIGYREGTRALVLLAWYFSYRDVCANRVPPSTLARNAGWRARAPQRALRVFAGSCSRSLRSADRALRVVIRMSRASPPRPAGRRLSETWVATSRDGRATGGIELGDSSVLLNEKFRGETIAIIWLYCNIVKSQKCLPIWDQN